MGNRSSISPLASYYANNPSSNQITDQESPLPGRLKSQLHKLASACADWIITGVAFPGFGIIGLWLSCYW